MKRSQPKQAKKTVKKAAHKPAKKTVSAASAAPKEIKQANAPATRGNGQRKAGQKDKKKKKEKKPPLMDTSIEGNLAVESHHLRVILREISSRFISDLESEIVRIVEMIGEVPDKDKKQAELRNVLKQMQSLRLKPQKGRLGDLRRIRNLVERVTIRLEEII